MWLLIHFIITFLLLRSASQPSPLYSLSLLSQKKTSQQGHRASSLISPIFHFSGALHKKEEDTEATMGQKHAAHSHPPQPTRSHYPFPFIPPVHFAAQNNATQADRVEAPDRTGNMMTHQSHAEQKSPSPLGHVSQSSRVSQTFFCGLAALSGARPPRATGDKAPICCCGDAGSFSLSL